MCRANWNYNIQFCHGCSTRCNSAFTDGGVLTQSEILLINSGGAADDDEMYEAHITENRTFRGYN